MATNPALPLRLRRSLATATLLVTTALAPPAPAQVASRLIQEGDPLPTDGPFQVVELLGYPAVNHVGGYAISIRSAGGTGNTSHVWGHPAGGPGTILRTAGRVPPLLQTHFSRSIGLADDGALVYSAYGIDRRPGTGPIPNRPYTVTRDDESIVVGGDPYPHAADMRWHPRTGFRAGATRDGTPYFWGALTSATGDGSFWEYGLFYGESADPVLLPGDQPSGLPFEIAEVLLYFGFSEGGSHYIAKVRMSTAPATAYTVVMDGAGLTIDGALVRYGSPVPLAAGGLPGESWNIFRDVGVNEAGDYFLYANTDANSFQDDILLKNGVVLHREGDVVDGFVLSGSPAFVSMNADGDIALRWGYGPGALVLNDQVLLQTGDTVDVDGDGTPDPGAIVQTISGPTRVSDRGPMGTVAVYFKADVDLPGLGRFEGFYRVVAQAGLGPVRASELAAGPELREPGAQARAAGSGHVTELLPASPNPFFDRTRASFTLAAQSRTTLEVFDVAGRRVVTLVDEVLSAGRHEVWWNGVGRDGSPGAAGVYFYRLTSPETVRTQKIVRLSRN